MKVTKESTGELTAILQIDLMEEDYAEAVSKQLKDMRRKANMPGFRPGQVPMGMIKKMYEKGLIAEEVQNLINRSMFEFIEKEGIKILGHPLANEEKTGEIDWENQKDFTFYFDIGLEPEFELDLGNIEAEYFKIGASEKMLEDQIKRITSQFSNPSNPELSEEDDVIFGDFTEIDEEGNAVEDGIKIGSTVTPSIIQQEDIKKKFIGLKIKSEVIFQLTKEFSAPVDIASMLEIKKEEAEVIDTRMKFVVDEISRMVPAEINKDLFDKAFPNQNIETEEEFRAKVKEDIENVYSRESDKFFLNTASTRILDETPFEIPDEFMKRWIIASRASEENPAEELMEQYSKYHKSLKWQLLENKLVEKYSISVDRDELKDYYKTEVLSMYFPKGEGEDEEATKQREETLENIAENMLNNEEQSKQIFDFLVETKLTNTIKENIKLKETIVDLEGFNEEVKKFNEAWENQ